MCVCVDESTKRRNSRRRRGEEKTGGKGKNEDGMRENGKTTREDRDVKGQRSGRNHFPLGVAGSGQWSANATL